MSGGRTALLVVVAEAEPAVAQLRLQLTRSRDSMFPRM